MRHAHCRRTQGLTLIEMLASTVLLGLVATTVLRSWSAPSADARLRALTQEVVALDGRARVAARTGTRVMLAVDRKSNRLVASVRGDGASIAEVALAAPDTVAVRRDDARSTKSVLFQADGTSCDYSIELQHAGISARVDIAGLTGWATVAKGPR